MLFELAGLAVLAGGALGAKWYRDTVPPGVTSYDVALAKAKCGKGNAQLLQFAANGAGAAQQGGQQGGAAGAKAAAGEAALAALSDPCVQKQLSQKVKELRKFFSDKEANVRRNVMKAVNAPGKAGKKAKKQVEKTAKKATKKAKKILRGKF